MDFRNKAINNRTYQSFAQNIDKELECRLKFYRKLIRINNDYSKNVATADHDWQYKFEMLELEEALNNKKFKVPELKFPDKQKSQKRAELDLLIESLKNASKVADNDKSLALLDSKLERDEKCDGDGLKKTLFQGISHDKEGRYKYLKERLRKYPEEKYRYPVTSSMDYGWRLIGGGRDSLSTNSLLSFSKEIPSRKHGIKNDLQTSFYRSTGVLNDFWKNDTINIRKS